MSKWGVFLFLALQGSLCAAAPAVAIPVLSDELFKEWDSTSSPGCAVSVSQSGQLILSRAYGQADLEQPSPNTTETVFEAGSVAKQFTAAAILLLAQEGRLSLSDDVRKHLPELPDYGTTITLDHMLMHTSGLRDWGSIVQVGGWPRGTRAVTMEQALVLTARQRALNFKPGSRYSYSNTGYVLAALVVQRVTGGSLAAFTDERIFKPLGMTHTQWRDSFRRIVPGRAVAYTRGEHGYEQDMPFEDVYGHGGLLSTVGDLQIWNDALSTGRLGSGIAQQLEQIPVLPPGQISAYGRGLYVHNFGSTTEVSHDGATAGYRASLARYPERKLSIAVLCNAEDVNTSAVVRAIAQQLLPAATVPAGAPKPPSKFGNTAGAALAGTFYNELNGAKAVIVYRDGNLSLSNGLLLQPLSANTFGVKTGTFTFAGHNEFTARSPGGEGVLYRRAMELPPDAAALSTYVGEYRSEEVSASYQVSQSRSGLLFRNVERPEYVFELTPRGPDTFAGGDMVVRFLREARGGIAGASVATDRLFDLRFQKVVK